MSAPASWLSYIRTDVLSGTVVALALIPEAIAFSIIAGVDPKVGLYAASCMAMVIAFAGGRPAMISAATGATALLMTQLVKDYGLQYLLATTLLTGVLQVIAGYFKLGNAMRFVPLSVVTGFVNALAILIFMAQLPELIGVNHSVYIMTAAGLGIIYLFPRIPIVGKLLPSPLLCILVLTLVSIALGLNIHQVGDMGQLPDALPTFLLPDVPFNLTTLRIIFPYAAGIAAVGLLESMMTATIIDELTDTESDRNRECKGQGIANMVSGFFGGMAGCAMIGQSIINVKSGGRGRLSTFIAGFFLLILVVFLGPWIQQIPMAALVAVMIMVSIGTFSWRSLIDLKKHTLSTNTIMLSTVAVVLATHNLAWGVLLGVLLAALFFAHKISRFMQITSVFHEKDNQRTYHVVGQVFFASAETFIGEFDFKEAVERVHIDVSAAHFWDISAVAALDKVVIKFRREGAQVEVIGINAASATIIDRLAMHKDPQAVEKLIDNGH